MEMNDEVGGGCTLTLFFVAPLSDYPCLKLKTVTLDKGVRDLMTVLR